MTLTSGSASSRSTRWFPPSTSRVIPVICRASSDRRKHTAPAMSSASVSRPRGSAEPAAAPASAFQMGRVAVVRTSPGLTAFTRTPLPARSAAMVRVMAFSAALADA